MAKKRYDDGGKVTSSEDVGTARARADRASVAQGERDFGPKNSSVRNALGSRNPEPTVSPLIYITPKQGYKRGGKVKGK